jgi:hypothetical protein
LLDRYRKKRFIKLEKQSKGKSPMMPPRIILVSDMGSAQASDKQRKNVNCFSTETLAGKH